MSKFTEGTWAYWRHECYPYWCVGKKLSKKLIATVDGEANARLIAAAPYMYDILEALEHVHFDEDSISLMDRVDTLLASIDAEEAGA